MQLFAVEYDLNVVTVNFECRPPERRVETFTNPHALIERVHKLKNMTTDMHDIAGIKVNTNIKTYGGVLPEIALAKVLDPFGVVD